jgi:hypothetical protein
MYFVLRESTSNFYFAGMELSKFHIKEPMVVKDVTEAMVFRCCVKDTELRWEPELPEGDFIPVAVSIHVIGQ